ncbi:MAG: aminoacyl-tRNA hydrolase [Phycisphaerae bacterium]
MKLIAGLGNPGRQYQGSRHNLGFEVLDALARRWRVDMTRFVERFEGLLGEAQAGEQRVLLLKPATYMNLSGRSVAAAARFYKIEPCDVLVVYDELDLPVGGVRIRASGSAGGHKGMEDVLRHLGTLDVPRIRIGIGKVHRAGTVEHVLGGFAPDERDAVAQAIQTADAAAECWVREGIDAAMNKFNPRRERAPRRGEGGAAGAGPPQGEPQ